MRPTVDGGVAFLVEPSFSFNDREGVLGGGAGIQIDQGFAVDLLVQSRKLAPEAQRFGVIDASGTDCSRRIGCLTRYCPQGWGRC